MQNVNNKIQIFLDKHKNDQRYLFILFLLSLMVIVIVCVSLTTPAISMSGNLTCGKEEHSHSDSCYTKTLICTESMESHKHSEDCYTTETILICELEENENHTHTDECYSEKTILTCDIPETAKHTHTDECYEVLPSETNSTEAEIDEQSSDSDDQGIIVLDPIDAEQDALLSSIKKTNSLNYASTYSVNGSETVIDDISVDFGIYIKSITQKEVAGTETTESSKTVKFTITYNLPEQTLMNDNENRTIYCLLPDNVEIPEERSGVVRQAGQEIGTYTITDDGYIIIEFDQNFVKDGSTAISGDISFNAIVHKTTEDSNYETVTIGNVSVNVPFLSETVEQYDLSVNKSCLGYDRDANQVSYKIDITSYRGSGDGDITITDLLYYTDETLIHLDWEDGSTAVFTKTDSSGNTSEVTGTVSVAADGTVTITGLPALEAGESYSIEYTATLTPDSQTQIIKTNNKVTVSNGTLSDESVYYGEQAVSCGISKSGKYNDRNDTIEWTITVTNPFGDSLDGYSISDDMLGITNELTIKDASGNIIETLNESNNWTGTTGSLDPETNTFSFNSSAEGTGYTLSYETALPSEVANNTVSNKAVLKNGDTEISAPTADAYVWDRQNVSKYYSSVSYDSVYNVIIDWIVNLDFQIGDFNGQSYKDTMSSDADDNGGNYHYMTPEQKDTLNIIGYKADYTQVNLVKDTDYTVTWYDADGNEITSDDENIYSFEIVFADNDVISELCDIDIYYSATAVAYDMTAGSERTYYNKAEFAEIEKSASYTEKKKEPFYKYDISVDGQSSGASSTYHNVNDLDRDDDGNLILKWYVDVNESRFFSSDTDAVLIDTLPAGTSIVESSIRYGDWSSGSYSIISDSDMTYEISVNEDGQQVVTFTVPAALHNGEKFRINYEVTVSEEYVAQHKNARGNTSFTNSITTDGIDYAAEQTQVLERSLITKSGMDPSESYDGYIDYTIDVNPKAELLTNSGKITVTDTINYQYNTFVPTLYNVTVYTVETDENGNEVLTELDASQYTLNYTNDSINAKFTLELPDQTHLKIKYTYYCVYKNPEWYEPTDYGVVIYNSAELDFDTSSQTADYSDRYYLNNESEANATTNFQIEKVDSENYGIKLSGAKFALYKWDDDSSQWLVMTDITDGLPVWAAVSDDSDGDSDSENTSSYKIIETDSDGRATLPSLDDKVLYKIVEVSAPESYITSSAAHYFAVYTAPSSLPNEVSSSDIKVLLKGGIITITNDEMQTTEITVQKYWHDPSGFTGEHDEVEVALYQSQTDPSGKIDGPEITFNFYDENGNLIVTRTFNVRRNEDMSLSVRTLNAYLTFYGGVQINGVTIWCQNVDDDWYVSTVDEYPYFSGKMTHFGGWVSEDNTDDWQNDPDRYNEYTFIYENVTTNMVFDVSLNYSSSYSDYTVFYDGAEVGTAVTGLPDDAVLVGTAILNSENKWTYTWDNIPATDEYGYNYYYYVQETSTLQSYTPTYENNGANEGTIYITNTGDGYTNKMPSTGGTGHNKLVVSGAVLISGSGLIYFLSKRCNRRRKKF